MKRLVTRIQDKIITAKKFGNRTNITFAGQFLILTSDSSKFRQIPFTSIGDEIRGQDFHLLCSMCK
jgi:hypothetical protein